MTASVSINSKNVLLGVAVPLAARAASRDGSRGHQVSSSMLNSMVSITFCVLEDMTLSTNSP